MKAFEGSRKGRYTGLLEVLGLPWRFRGPRTSLEAIGGARACLEVLGLPWSLEVVGASEEASDGSLEPPRPWVGLIGGLLGDLGASRRP